MTLGIVSSGVYHAPLTPFRGVVRSASLFLCDVWPSDQAFSEVPRRVWRSG